MDIFREAARQVDDYQSGLHHRLKWVAKEAKTVAEVLKANGIQAKTKLRKWTEYKLYYCLDTALSNRKADQHVFALDWAHDETGAKTKRFVLASKAQLQQLEAFLKQRPVCDQTLYTINMGGFGMRALIFDLETLFIQNPNLNEEQYVLSLLGLLQEFLGLQELPPFLAGKSSDSCKFSVRLYVVHETIDQVEHDRTILKFWKWMWERRRNDGRVQTLIVTQRYKDDYAYLSRAFAIDVKALGRNRQQRVIGYTKAGVRRFELMFGAKADLSLMMPINLNKPAPIRSEEEETIILHRERILEDQSTTLEVEHCTSFASPPPECTFMYQNKDMYNFLSQYKVKSGTVSNVMWSQPCPNGKNRVRRFFVPWNKYDELLQLQAKGKLSFLHETIDQDNDQTRRASIDIDDCPMDPHQILREYCAFAETQDVSLKLSSTKGRCHLIARQLVFANADSLKEHRRRFDTWMCNKYDETQWRRGCLDVNPQNLRMLGSSKGPDTTSRLRWGGKEDVAVIEQLRACSIHNLYGIAAIELVKQKHKSHHDKTPGVVYNAENPRHRVMAMEIAAIIGEHRISTVVEAENIAYLGCGFCLTVNKTKERPTNMHKSHGGIFRFHKDKIVSYCFDSDCATYRSQHGFPTHRYSSQETQAVLFGPQWQVVQHVPPVVELSLPRNLVEQHITRACCPEDQRVGIVDNRFLVFPNGVQVTHYCQLRAFQHHSDGSFALIPHELYSGEAPPEALIFRAFFPSNTKVYGFADDTFLLEGQEKRRIELGKTTEASTEQLAVLRKAFHLRRLRKEFPGVPVKQFGEVQRLWDYNLQHVIEGKTTYYVYSGKGTGKSHQNERLIRDPYKTADGILNWQGRGKPCRVLIVSPLIAVAEFYAKVYNAKCYKETERSDWAEIRRLVISLESLCALPANYATDILVLDESEWLLQIFSGDTMKDRRAHAWACFKQIVASAKLVIASDARLGAKTFHVLHALRPGSLEHLFYNYHQENDHAWKIYKEESRWQAEIDKADGKIFAAVTSKEQAVQMARRAQQLRLDAKVLLVTADTYRDDEYVRHAVRNCAVEWIKFDYVIVSPVVGPAIDFSVLYFDHCFAWGTPLSCTPAQFSQLIGRVRHIKTKVVQCFINGHSSKTVSVMDVDRMRSKIVNSLKHTTALGLTFGDQIRWNFVEQRMERGVSDKLMLDLHASNLVEDWRKKRYFTEQLQELLLLQQGKYAEIVTEDDKQVKQEMKEQRSKRKQERQDEAWERFDSASDITKPEAEEIQKRFKRGEHVPSEQLDALTKRQYRDFYMLANNEEVERNEFEQDTKTKRQRFMQFEQDRVIPNAQAMLAQVDNPQMLSFTLGGATVVDLRLKAVPATMNASIFRVFFGPLVSLPRYNPLLHVTCADYWERTFAHTQLIDHLKIYSFYNANNFVPLDKEGGCKTILRAFLTQTYGLRLERLKRMKTKTDVVYAINREGLEEHDQLVTKRHRSDRYCGTQTTSYEEFSINVEASSQEAFIAFVLAFSPYQLPCLATVEFVPTKLGREMPKDFARLCKRHCPAGILLRLGAVDLYYQYEQFWVLHQQKTFYRFVSVKDAVTFSVKLGCASTGDLYFADANRAPESKSEEWAAKFSKLCTVKN